MRGQFVLACTLLAVGGLSILLSADWRDAAISPGPLARQHAQLLESGRGESNCAACHAAAERGTFGWTASLVAGHGGRPGQSDRCLECHDKTISREFALSAHNLPPEALEEITRSGEPPGLSRRDQPAGSRRVEELACATCHREHQGAEFDLKEMNNAACQSCHQRRYESFGTDHPDFGAWPYERRTRIAFDHASHRSKHFAEKKQAFDCRSCHLDDSTGQVQLLASYEAACAGCHDEKIATSVANGVPMFTLPTLDIDALKAAGHEIDSWPEEASGDFDGRLPPVMKLLLAADPSAARAMATLGEDFEFLDVDPDDPEQLEACAELAKAIRVLMVELSHRGPLALRERLAATLDRNVSGAELPAITAGLAVDIPRSALRAWFPEEDGVADDGPATLALDPPHAAAKPKRALAFDPAGTWKYDDTRLAIRYRPAAHADPVLTGWLELLAATPNLTQQPLALAMFKELSKPTAPGLCTSCHSVENTTEKQLTINWRAYDRVNKPRGFTKFSHGPHLVLPQLAGCTHCHTIDESNNAAASYTDWESHSFVSEFAPLSKQQCVECHTEKAAGNRCQQCHNYHVEAVESWRLKNTSD
jgi:predicted CXXCH cytochrome family protein